MLIFLDNKGISQKLKLGIKNKDLGETGEAGKNFLKWA